MGAGVIYLRQYANLIRLYRLAAMAEQARQCAVHARLVRSVLFPEFRTLPADCSDTGSPAINEAFEKGEMTNLHVYHYAGNNPVKYVDPDGRSGGLASLFRDEFRQNIDKAIAKIASSEFGKTLEGKVIVDKLFEMNNAHRIISVDLNVNNNGDKITNGAYDKKEDIIFLDINLPVCVMRLHWHMKVFIKWKETKVVRVIFIVNCVVI
jgi:hypothetical protein